MATGTVMRLRELSRGNGHPPEPGRRSQEVSITAKLYQRAGRRWSTAVYSRCTDGVRIDGARSGTTVYGRCTEGACSVVYSSVQQVY